MNIFNKQDDKNFEYIKYYIQLEKNDSKKNSLLLDNKCPIYLKEDCLYSKISDLSININNSNNNCNINDENIAFTPVFNEMIDLIHFGFCTGTSIIFEGFPGQGKQKAVNYYCKLLNCDVENIVITSNFTAKDLFKKSIVQTNSNGIVEIVEVKTKLYQTLFNNDIVTNKKILFVFHNIHLAESDVLLKISECFNKKYKDNNYSFIGFISLKESLIERNTYYYNYFYNSIYYIVNDTNNVTMSYLNEIIPKNLEIDKSLILKHYNNIDINNNKFTLSDISRYIKLKEISQFDNLFLEEMTFKNKSTQIQSNNSFDLEINYMNGYKKELIMEVNDKSISIETNEIFQNFEEEYNTLSFEQRKCLIFLGLSVKANVPCIIQGTSGVGKSHLIKLFAKILGKKLNIFELNKDNDISLLTKQCKFEAYNDDETKEIEEKLNDILHNYNINYINIDFQKKFEKVNEIKNLDEESKKTINALKEKYKFINRFKYVNSLFLDTVQRGEWVLFDGIENAPSIIMEKIALLCGENPEINLYDKGMDSIKPQPGFHLFMTYNPERVNHNKSISYSLLDKCLIYNLSSFLIDKEITSQIIYGFFVKLNLDYDDENILLDISSRLSNIVNIIKSQLNEGDSEKISERTLINFCKNLDFIKNNISLNIKNNLMYFYFPSLNEDKKYNIIKIINENIERQGINFKPIAKSYTIECKKLLKLLTKFKENNANIGALITECLKAPFKYLNNIIKSIDETIVKSIDNNNKGLNILLLYLNELKNESINSKKQIKDCSLSRIVNSLILFGKIMNNNLYSFDYIDLIYSYKYDIFLVFKGLYIEQNIESLKKFFLSIEKIEKEFIQDIFKLFPYYLFENSKFKLINHIIKCIQKLRNNNINFKIKIEKEEYFCQIKNEKINITIDLGINDKKELIITKNTKVFVEKKNITKINEIKNLDNNNFNNFIILLIDELVNCNDIDDENLKNILKKSKNIYQNEKNIYLNFKIFFKNNTNSIINIWSLIFLNNQKLNKSLLSFLDIVSSNKVNIDLLVFKDLFDLYDELINKENKKDILEMIEKIEDLNNKLYRFINTKNILYNISFDKNYNNTCKTLDEKKDILKKINEELINVKNEPKIFTIFSPFQTKYENEIEKIKKEIRQMEIEIYKNKILEKLDKCNLKIKLKNELIKEIKIRNKENELQEYEMLLDNYSEENQKKNKKNHNYVKLFCQDEKNNNLSSNLKSKYDSINSNLNINNHLNKDCFYNKVMQEEKPIKQDISGKKIQRQLSFFFQNYSYNIEKEESLPTKKDFDNKNCKLIELLLEYSQIKEIVEKIKNNSKTKLIYLQELNEIIDEKAIDIFNCFVIPDIENNIEYINIIEATCCSMLIQKVITGGLEDNLLNIKKLINNLYNADNYNKIDETWCKNIEKKYKYDTIIYFPVLNILSFKYLFVRINDFRNMNEIKGFLINENDIYDNKLFECIKGNKLQIETSNISNDNKKKELTKLISGIEIILNIIYLNNDNLKINEKILLDNFKKLKNLFNKYINEEILYYFDINYPSLIYYFNSHIDIYEKFQNKNIMTNYKHKSYYIPLWLICIRSLANSNNINISFKNITKDLETKLKSKIINKISNNKSFKNIDWLLLISPNNINFSNNKSFENMYNFFKYLINEINISNDLNMYINYSIKQFIVNIFDRAFEVDTNYSIIKDKILLDFPNVLSNKIKQKFNDNEYIKQIKYYLSFFADNNFENKIKTFEDEYNKYISKEIESDYSNIEKICKDYNYLVKNKIKNGNFKEKKNIIISYIETGDVYYKDLLIFSLFSERTVEVISKDQYIQKNQCKKEMKQIKYGNDYLNAKQLLSHYENASNICNELLKKLNNLLDNYNIDNIDSNVNNIDKLKRELELKITIFTIKGIDNTIHEKIVNLTNIDLIVEVSKKAYILKKIVELYNTIFIQNKLHIKYNRVIQKIEEIKSTATKLINNKLNNDLFEKNERRIYIKRRISFNYGKIDNENKKKYHTISESKRNNDFGERQKSMMEKELYMKKRELDMKEREKSMGDLEYNKKITSSKKYYDEKNNYHSNTTQKEKDISNNEITKEYEIKKKKSIHKEENNKKKLEKNISKKNIFNFEKTKTFESKKKEIECEKKEKDKGDKEKEKNYKKEEKDKNNKKEEKEKNYKRGEKEKNYKREEKDKKEKKEGNILEKSFYGLDNNKYDNFISDKITKGTNKSDYVKTEKVKSKTKEIKEIEYGKDKKEDNEIEKTFYGLVNDEQLANNCDSKNIAKKGNISDYGKIEILKEIEYEEEFEEIKEVHKKIKVINGMEDENQIINEYKNIISNIEKGIENMQYSYEVKDIYYPNQCSKDKEKGINEVYLTKELINISQIYIDKFFEQLTKSNINFGLTSLCIIIDCSQHLGEKAKLINIMLILSIIKVIEIVGIKYAILLSGDFNFKVIIKKFEETANFEDLIEKIYELCFIKRGKHILAESIISTVEKIKCPNIKNTLYFVFCDCVDDSILNINYWINNILNSKNNSFILFVEKGNYYENKNSEIINKMWNNFEEKVKKAESKLKIINIDTSNQYIFIDVFKDISEFLNNNESLINIDENENEKQQNDIDANVDIDTLSRKDISHFESILENETYKKYDKINFFNKKIESVSLSNKINNNNKKINYKYEKKEIPEIKAYTSKLKQSFQDRTLIESIFNPNKATQKQLSTKGTEIDVMALILYTLHPVQEPMIYLEEKGGMIRDYSISIIIDNSKSCFSSFNETHSYLTIINLFKIINSTSIPSFDLIVTGNKNQNPHILLFDRPSVTVFENDIVFEKLLKLLSNPLLKTDLSAAIKTVYDLKKIKKNDRESYLFILTDGLIHKKDEKRINYTSKLCQSIGIKVFSIGLGIYPYKAKELFETFIYSVNPENLLKAISKIFGRSIKTENELSFISENRIIQDNDISKVFSKIQNNNKFYYEKLRKELEKIEIESVILSKQSEKVKKKVKKLIRDKNQSQEFLKTIDLNKALKTFKEYTGQTFDIHDLELAHLDNPILYEERKKEIKEIGNILLKEPIKSSEDYLENVTKFGQKMKENIIYEVYNYPEKFVKPEDIQNAKEGSLEFIEGTLSSLLSQNNITCAIEKETSNNDISRICLQLMTSGEAFRKIIKICSTQGEEKDALILSNEEEKTKFIKEKKKLYSELLDLPEDDIIISHLEYGSNNWWMLIKGKDLNKDIGYIKKIKEDVEKRGEIKDIILANLICSLTVSPYMFDLEWNRDSGWGEGEQRGPPDHLIDYDPPLKWYGYGLNVKDYPDNEWLGYEHSEGEWYIAYHGTNIAGPILEQGFKYTDDPDHQCCENSDNVNELTKKKYKKLDRGVYVTPFISVAEDYSNDNDKEGVCFNEKKYSLVFMCRVNPHHVRMQKKFDSHDKHSCYWVVSGEKLDSKKNKKYDDEIRPYRILIKEAK